MPPETEAAPIESAPAEPSAPAPPAAEPAPPAPDAGQVAPPEGAPAQPAAPDLSEQVQQLTEEVRSWRQGQQPTAEPTDDIASALAAVGQEGWNGEEEFYEDEAYGQPGYDQQGQPQQPLSDQERFQLAMREAARAELEPYIAYQEEQRRTALLNELPNRYPDIREPQMIQRIGVELDQLVPLYGEGVRNDPLLVERIYQGIKAEQRAATETPAEEARNSETALETQAGPGNQGGEESYEQRAAREIRQAGGAKSVFTSG